MNSSENLATKFRKKQINSLFLKCSIDLLDELKPNYFVICSSASLEDAILNSILEKTNLILVTDDANRCLQLKDVNFTVVHYNKKNDGQEEFLREIIFSLLNSKYINEQSNLLITFNKNDWEVFSQITFLELANVAESNYLKSLTSLTHIASIEILETVIEVAIELGREGREGKPVGTIIVLGDHKNVLDSSRPLVFNPFKGYKVAERNILKQEVRDSLKEMAKIDGALVISENGIVQAGGQYLDFRANEIQIPPGLGSRHTAAAAVSKGTKCLAVAISESTGVVRVFVDGNIFLQINPRQSSPIRF